MRSVSQRVSSLACAKVSSYRQASTPARSKFILDHVALPYSQIKSFNDLPTPFACVATELNTEQAARLS